MTLIKEKKRNIKIEGSVNNLQSPCSEFNTNGGLGFQTEFVTRKPGENIGFSNARITDQDNLEEIIVFMIHLVSHLNKLILIKYRA